ncbi:hypothetical protein [Moorena sp. SIO2C4]|uniref:hypothetical protein n=1 Tax=Moorena sp. SIO2C4 TaxID=2607824 RepID=UPI00257978CC|nr:hypothetical protein [Moorena sp. SIO2C4]
MRGYFIGEDETDPELSVTPTNQATESAIGEKSEGNGEVESIVGETVTSSVAVEEVQEVALGVQLSESVPVAAISEEKLEVNKDSCPSAKAGLWERLPAPILALALFDQETGNRGNSQYCSVQREKTGKKYTSHTSHTPHARAPHSQILPVLGKFLSGGAEEAITARDGGMLGRITATTLFSKLILQESPRSPPTAEKTIKIQNSFPVVGFYQQVPPVANLIIRCGKRT